MNKEAIKKQKRMRRHGRVRAKIVGTKGRPRLAVFKSNRFVYGQIIDDEKGNTLVSISSVPKKGETKTKSARDAGEAIAKEALTKKIKHVVFDRGGFLYSGVVKEFADGARAGGLQF